MIVISIKNHLNLIRNNTDLLTIPVICNNCKFKTLLDSVLKIHESITYTGDRSSGPEIKCPKCQSSFIAVHKGFEKEWNSIITVNELSKE